MDSVVPIHASDLYRMADAHWLSREYAEALNLYKQALAVAWHSISELRFAQCLFALGQHEEIVLDRGPARIEGWKRLEAFLALASQDAEALRSLVDWINSPKLKRRIGLAIDVLNREAELSQITQTDREMVKRMVGWAKDRDFAAMLSV